MNEDLLRRLVVPAGVPGFEGPIRAVVKDEIKDLVDEVTIDRLGNLIGRKGGTGGPTILIAAHMDEIGFVVRHVDAAGFLRLQPLGSFDPRVLVAQRVIVHAQGGECLAGTIETTVEPLHFSPPRNEGATAMEDLFVDVGSAVARVEVGDAVTLDREVLVGGDRVVSKALDDRLGIYVMIEALRLLEGRTAATIVAVATVQEEVGSRGAVVAGYSADPDICIALDLTVANDIPGALPDRMVTRLGSGPAIKIVDTTQISHPGIVLHMRDLARAYRIPYQLEVLNHGGTDASLIQRLRAGVAVVTLSIPARYIHTVNETVAISDVDHAVRLLANYLEDAHNRDYTVD